MAWSSMWLFIMQKKIKKLQSQEQNTLTVSLLSAQDSHQLM